MGFPGLVVALVALGLSFEFQAALGHAAKWATVGSMLLFCAFFAMSLGPLGWLIISEIYPLRVRGVGASVGSLSHWLWNAVIAFNFLTVVNALGPARTFWLFAAAPYSRLSRYSDIAWRSASGRCERLSWIGAMPPLERCS